ncbi:MAG: hypothetical protein U0V03_00515 [Bacteroidia bacterium]
MPNSPVIKASFFTRSIVLSLAFVSEFAEISFTPLVPSPNPVILETIPVVELYNPTTPIPAGPKKTAMNFDLIL